ncbi:MAG: lactonase family protein [Paludibacter sp.]|nr:lactonase family protein [Paludibacter sp.]
MKKFFTISIILLFTHLTYMQSCKYKLLVGTYTNTGKSEGIYSYEIDMKKGDFIQKSITKNIVNPSFLALTPDKKFVYAVCENDKGSAAKSFSFNKKIAQLTPINTSLTKSGGPCNILATEKNVFTANYGGGSVSVFGRNNDGSITEAKQLIRHSGGSINKERQNEAHVHQVILSKDKKYIIANDLGTDNVTVYNYYPNADTEILVPFDTLQVKLGSGPRHATFSKNGEKLYLVQEIDGTVSVLGFDKGKLSLIQETSLVKKENIINRAADIHLSPDEKFLYVTNRGNANDITCFSVAKDGELTFIQQISTMGDGPRNFAITPDGKFVFVAHQFTDNIVVFERNKKTGMLTDTGKRMNVGSPVCLIFY